MKIFHFLLLYIYTQKTNNKINVNNPIIYDKISDILSKIENILLFSFNTIQKKRVLLLYYVIYNYRYKIIYIKLL